MEKETFDFNFLRDVLTRVNYIVSFPEISIGKARVGIIHCSAYFAAKGERWTGEGEIARRKTSERGNFGVSRRSLRGY
jgi:hypothetical protein